MKAWVKIVTTVLCVGAVIFATYMRPLERAGILRSKDIRYVIYQPGTSTLPESPLFPSSPPHVIHDTTSIKAFYDAFKHPKKNPYLPKTASNSRLAFVTRNGVVLIHAVGGAETKSSLVDLSNAFKTSRSRGSGVNPDTTSIPHGQLQSIIYHEDNGKADIKLHGSTISKPVENLLWELTATYNPLGLKGNVLHEPKDLQRFLAKSPGYVEVVLQKPVTLDAVVVPDDLDINWPPYNGDTRARLKSLTFDRIYISQLDKSYTEILQFAFQSSKTGECMFTGGIRPLEVKAYRANNLPIYGSNLYDKLLSEVHRSAKKSNNDSGEEVGF